MEHAANIGCGEQFGQRVFCGGLDLPEPFAQFWRDIGQAHGSEKCCLIDAFNAFFTAV